MLFCSLFCYKDTKVLVLQSNNAFTLQWMKCKIASYWYFTVLSEMIISLHVQNITVLLLKRKADSVAWLLICFSFLVIPWQQLLRSHAHSVINLYDIASWSQGKKYPGTVAPKQELNATFTGFLQSSLIGRIPSKFSN